MRKNKQNDNIRIVDRRGTGETETSIPPLDASASEEGAESTPNEAMESSAETAAQPPEQWTQGLNLTAPEFLVVVEGLQGVQRDYVVGVTGIESVAIAHKLLALFLPRAREAKEAIMRQSSS